MEKINNQKFVKMSERSRELMLRVVDGCAENIPIVHQLSHYRSVDGICQWLIKHGYTGKVLVPWLRGQFCNSTLMMVKWIVAKHNKEKMKPILLGRDWN